MGEKAQNGGRMQSINKSYSTLYEIQKSKFYAFAYPVFDVQSTDEILSKIRLEHKTATHICFAYILDQPKTEKASDDGEPSGTAGKPMLELLKKKKLSNVLLVVVRYFGGVKLGAGGLVRAYTTASNMALDGVKVTEFFEVNKYLCKCPLSTGAKVLSSIQSSGGEVTKNVFGVDTEIEFFYNGDIDGVLLGYKDVKIEKIGSELRCR